ncbi:MAG: hypothetical protein GW779_03585 [Candidatus Altiarchaeum hamiconexum]|uniref:Uncharacterized ATP-binding protein MJ1010-like C-terminal domain-containing protein n=1 Tax=Candidatus Altarchaeum hamiconexum TaxID=1803513 RepID=A0A8J7YYM3_9ARCH|nr:hypothetical protein [Candidatus Altarchaeum hamiconexum]PIN67374.1 MAG: hypothetical protein COV98_03195 [Candidatus Altarchaeum sp. CG12_big_fil_rev_8_21_14_0_65_33_22]PIV27369.1 MAG: hypothetical protein COS36_05965 [Candidatus Altarchaeum sp. CG03_land_8_20_14_0_80_32_618]PIX49502.1 MAG: hypothetical protein COZ53_00445 [Candidatus Altarchaeum sp. CG_4_8_14_3_um_filter_33_2054]PIZ29783.1 MAG: hypothetical protein COY41_05085 [Candidatus Altarchaeum sp. CG_4_10_14_0_8_um_filter_32_851]PJ
MSEVADNFKSITKSYIGSRIYKLKELKKDEKLFENVVNTLKKFKDYEEVDYFDADYNTSNFLINANILFFDLQKWTIKPQLKINLIAIREILKEIKK